jgi:hypothetical protein
MPDGSVTLPGGAKIKKNVAIAIGVGAVGIAAYVLYRQKQASSSPDTSGYSTADVDPQTGYPYGSPEDQAALAALSGGTMGQTNQGASWVGGQTIGYDQFGQPVYGQGGGSLGGPGSFTNNAQWTSFCESAMGSTGGDAIAAALGKYLLGQPLSDEQVTSVQQAIAIGGFPPVAGAEGFPPSYKTMPAPPPTGGSGTAKNPVKQLRTEPRFTQIDAHWAPLSGATKYQVKAHHNGRIVDQATVAGTFATMNNLHKNTLYRITVWATPGSGAMASTNARTKK